jgi:hypothetical protein
MQMCFLGGKLDLSRPCGSKYDILPHGGGKKEYRGKQSAHIQRHKEIKVESRQKSHTLERVTMINAHSGIKFRMQFLEFSLLT